MRTGPKFHFVLQLKFWAKLLAEGLKVLGGRGEREVHIRKVYLYSFQNLWVWSKLPLQTTTGSEGPRFRVLILYCRLQHAAPKFQMWWRTSDELVESCSKIPKQNFFYHLIFSLRGNQSSGIQNNQLLDFHSSWTSLTFQALKPSGPPGSSRLSRPLMYFKTLNILTEWSL